MAGTAIPLNVLAEALQAMQLALSTYKAPLSDVQRDALATVSGKLGFYVADAMAGLKVEVTQ